MSVEIVMPRAGLTMVEGTISEWKVAEGAQVNKGDVLMEYENEKNVIECEALESGIINLVAKEGETIPVGGVIAVMAADQGEYDALVNGGAPAAAAPAFIPTLPLPLLPPSPAVASGPPALPRSWPGRPVSTWRWSSPPVVLTEPASWQRTWRIT